VTATVSTARTGDYLVVQIATPGALVENAGVLLVDPENDTPYLRFRRDLADLDEDNADILEALPQDLELKARELGAKRLLDWLEENASGFVQVTDRERVLVDRFEKALNRLYERHVRPKVLPFRTHLPVYTLAAAAGRWGEHMQAEPEGWVEAPERLRLTDDMFVAHVVGRSMEPRIPAGSLCVFQGGAALAGSRQGRLVLVEHYGETGENRYTIKRYRSVKRQSEEGWTHDRIILEPLNPEYEAWELTEDSPIRVVGEFVQVLESE
jgi:SOS-response transcriptional repressor LexA